MNGQDQAFIEAYRHSDAESPGPAEATTSRASEAAKRSSSRVRYRIDAGQVASPAPAPHAAAFQKPRSEVNLDLLSVSVSTWDMNAAMLPDQALVMASLLPLPADSSAVANRNEEETPVPAAKTAAEVAQESPRGESSPSDSGNRGHVDEVVAPVAVAAAPATRTTFKPVWEVDRFVWPADVDLLYDAEAAYFSYAGQKLREAAREGLRVLALASAREGEGCTTLAICLARAASESGVRVALIDGNLDHPHLAARMGVRFSHGWSDTLTGEVPLGEAAITSLEHAVTLLPLCDSVAQGTTALSDPRVSALIRDVAASVDLVVLDLGVVANTADQRFELGANGPVDAAIVVRDMRHTPASQTLAVAALLKESGVNAVGIAENYAPPRNTAGKAAA